MNAFRATCLSFVWSAFALLSLCGTAACGDDDDGGGTPDAQTGTPDAAAVIDAAPPDAGDLVDGGALSACGDEIRCSSETEICVVTTTFAGPVFACQPVPEGCEADRNCACTSGLCMEAEVCADADAPNTIHCECLAC